MSIRGPKPKPAEVAEKQGNPGRRPIVKPRERSATPVIAGQAPDWLDEMGLHVWQTYMPRLKGMGYVKDTDMAAFARLCDHTSRWLRLRTKVNERGESYTTESRHGKMERMNPDFVAMLRIEGQMTALEDRFGLTPSARQQILARITEPADIPLNISGDGEGQAHGSPIGMLAPRPRDLN